ncbi:MAG: phosphatidylserine decarboxylase family protein [Rickettsiales bacterium]|jgi:phosphatidylserine decarboxylase|nr:phosphatidylserine decarboxylase family protein [Rickettsiales bacterium]
MTKTVPNVSTNDILLPNISREGVNIVVLAFLIAAILLCFSAFLGSIALAAAIFTFYFFRDPERVAPDGRGLALAPADGIVLPIQETTYPKETGEKGRCKKISIFMSVFNVHVNRNPVSGAVLKTEYVEGKFADVRQDKDSEDNERSITLVETDGAKVAVAQIAGYVARRVVNRLSAGDKAEAGERFGLIKFGSRLDVYLPAGEYEITVKPGQRTIAGETVIARRK